MQIVYTDTRGITCVITEVHKACYVNLLTLDPLWNIIMTFLLIALNTRFHLNLTLCFLNTIHPKGGSPGDVSEEPVTYEKRKKGLTMSCDIDKATEGLENEL